MRFVLLLLAVGVSAQTAPADLGIEWETTSEWLAPVDVNRRYLGGAVDYGTNYVLSSLPDREIPPVRVVFGGAVESRARVFDRADGYRDLGEGSFRGAAYDVSDPGAPRRLNIGFAEDRREREPDGVWNPDGSVGGGREYLFVFDSDYAEGAPRYAGETLWELDVAYGFALRVADGRSPYDASAAITLTPPPLRDVVATAVENGVAEVAWVAPDFVSAPTVEVRDGATVLAVADAADGVVRIGGFDPGREVTLTVDRAGDAASGRTVTVRPRVSLGVAGASSLDPGRAGNRTYGDVWGYTAPDGTEYALLTGRGDGLSIIDITAAPDAPPVEVGFIARVSGARDAKDVKVYGRHAYVVHEVGPVQIVDLADPAAPVEVGRIDVQPGVTDGGAHNVLVARGHLWVTGGRTSGNAGVRAYSLADPAAPVLVGAYRPDHLAVPYYHDFEVVGDRGYGPAIYGGGVDVLDVSDPSDIRRLTETPLDYPGAGAHNTCTTEDGNTVYVGDEVGSQGRWMRIFDVADVQDPELVGEIVVDAQASVHNCYVRGDRLFVAHYTEGLRVFDVSSPHAPVEVALYDTYLQPGYDFAGAWTAYPYFASGKIIVSDMQSGLWVVTLDGLATSSESPTASPAALTVWPNPARGAATVGYSLAAPARVSVRLVDALGRTVADVADRELGPGNHRTLLDVGALPAGVYRAVVTVGDRSVRAVPVTVVR